MLGELVARRDILTTLVEKDFKARYKAKALGRLWSIADPLIMVSIFTIVFVYIFKVGEPNFPVFLLLAITPYRFTTNSLNAAANSIVDNVQLVKRLSFPRLYLPLAVVLSHTLHFFIELGLLAALFFVFPDALQITPNLAYLPLIFFIHLAFLVGLGLIVAALNVRYRDMQYMLASALSILYWLTPIFYKFTIVPDRLAKVLMWNPMVGIVSGYRSVVMDGMRPSFTLLGASAIVALVSLGIGLAVFRHHERLFADYL